MRNEPDKRYLISEPPTQRIVRGGKWGVNTIELLTEDERKEIGATYLTPRHALHQIGDGVRKADPDVWLRYGLNQAKKIIILKKETYGSTNKLSLTKPQDDLPIAQDTY